MRPEQRDPATGGGDGARSKITGERVDEDIVTDRHAPGRDPSTANSGARPTSSRRTKAEITALEDAMVELLAEEYPTTVRGMFYRMVSAGLIDKTENEYKNVTARLLLRLRRDGRIPYSWITDGTRWMRKPSSYADVDEALAEVARFYRRRLWSDQDTYVEVWCEKDAMAGILYEVTAEFDVPLMVARGFASETFLHEAAEAIRAQGRPTFVYHFGDRDPSGVKAAEAIGRRLAEFAPDVDLTFVQAAVTAEQVDAWQLPTRPTKRTSTHSKGWRGESVELDAVPTARLHELTRECIEHHLDPWALEQTRQVEAEEREVLEAMAGRFAA